MKKFIDKHLKKIVICFIVGVCLLVFLFIYLVVFLKIDIETFKNDTFSLKYDSSYKITKEEKDSLTLKRGSEALVNVSTMELSEEQMYERIDTLIEEIEYGIIQQNKEYSLLAEEKKQFTAKNIDGYKFLYEKDKGQVLVVAIKIVDKLVTFTYEADTDYFDILLDSVYSIIYSFELKKETFTLNTKIEDIETEKLEWSGDIKVTDTTKHNLINESYMVDYELPDQFKRADFDLSSQRFYLKDKEGDELIEISASFTGNIYYQVIDRIPEEIKRLKDNKKDVVVKISENPSYKGSYIYKITYQHENYLKKMTSKEKVFIILPLDKKNAVIICVTNDSGLINSDVDTAISSDIINNINITNKKKIASPYVRNKENGYIVNELNKFIDYNHKDYYNVKLYTKEDWYENGPLFQINEGRDFGKNCSEDDPPVCEYGLLYHLIGDTYGLDKLHDRFGYLIPSNDEIPIVYKGVGTYDNKSFRIYSVEYSANTKSFDRSNESRHKFYQIILDYQINEPLNEYDETHYLLVSIKRMDQPIDLNEINEIVKFDITKEIYN